MATIDAMVREILQRYGVDPREACWDCHGTWVIYHRYLERIADKAGILFDKPEFVHTDAREKEAVMLVTGHMGDKSAWSIGEAMPYNNKNTYPFAMSEKRGKDRVILKLAGLSGHVYSEEEADDFKKSRPSSPPPPSRPEEPIATAAAILTTFVAPVGSPEVEGEESPELPKYMSMEEREEMIIAALEGKPPMGRSDIMEITGLTISRFSNASKSLVEKGIIALEGQRRGARYRLLNGGSTEQQPPKPVEVVEQHPAVQRMVEAFDGEVVSSHRLPKPPVPRPPAPVVVEEGVVEALEERFKAACSRVVSDGFTWLSVSTIVEEHTGCKTAAAVVANDMISVSLVEALESFNG